MVVRLAAGSRSISAPGWVDRTGPRGEVEFRITCSTERERVLFFVFFCLAFTDASFNVVDTEEECKLLWSYIHPHMKGRVYEIWGPRMKKDCCLWQLLKFLPKFCFVLKIHELNFGNDSDDCLLVRLSVWDLFFYFVFFLCSLTDGFDLRRISCRRAATSARFSDCRHFAAILSEKKFSDMEERNNAFFFFLVVPGKFDGQVAVKLQFNSQIWQFDII